MKALRMSWNVLLLQWKTCSEAGISFRISCFLAESTGLCVSSSVSGMGWCGVPPQHDDPRRLCQFPSPSPSWLFPGESQEWAEFKFHLRTVSEPRRWSEQIRNSACVVDGSSLGLQTAHSNDVYFTECNIYRSFKLCVFQASYSYSILENSHCHRLRFSGPRTGLESSLLSCIEFSCHVFSFFFSVLSEYLLFISKKFKIFIGI